MKRKSTTWNLILLGWLVLFFTGVISAGVFLIVVPFLIWRSWKAASAYEKSEEYEKDREELVENVADIKAAAAQCKEEFARIDALKRPVATEFLKWGTVSKFGAFGRGLVGSLIFGWLGAAIGVVTTDYSETATFMVTYANGKKKKETVLVKSKKFDELWNLRVG